MRKTKIVCTLGPSTDDEAVLRELILSGMNVARLNMSHGTHEEQKRRADMVKKLRKELDVPVAILLDTKGPEIRTGKFAEKVMLTHGQKYTLTTNERPGDAEGCSITFKDLPKDVHRGSHILIDDGLIEMVVEKVTDTDIECRLLNDGPITSYKGINVPGVTLSMPYISEKDRADLEFCVKEDFEFIAASFTRSAEDIVMIRNELEKNNCRDIRIIAKIENTDGVENIDDIIRVSDGIMVARGDLGVELPAEAIPNTQRRIVEKCICAKRPVIIATQMLYSMVKSPRPTRAEVSDVASAIYERVDAVMLSDETAMGDYPVESVETMARVAREIERDETHFKPMIDMDMVSVNHEITAQLARSAVRASTNLPIKYVVLDTKTGRTGRYLAAFRGRKTVMAVCYQLHAQRILALSYGVVPILRNQELHDKYHFLVDALEFLDQYRKLKGEDLLAIVGGSFGPDGGASYVEIANVDNIRRRNEEIVAAQKC